MKSRTDPIRSKLLVLAVAVTTVVIGVPMLALWAFIPAAPMNVDRDWQPATTPIDETIEQSIDYAVFDTELWHEPAAPAPAQAVVSAPPQPAMPQAPRLTLVGILTDPSREGAPPTRRAVLYDPTTDELIFASVGDTIASVLVDAIEETTVRLAVADQMYLMPLDGDAGWDE